MMREAGSDGKLTSNREPGREFGYTDQPEETSIGGEKGSGEEEDSGEEGEGPERVGDPESAGDSDARRSSRW